MTPQTTRPEDAFRQPPGRWRCLLCEMPGFGGVDEFELHYMRAHITVGPGGAPEHHDTQEES